MKNSTHGDGLVSELFRSIWNKVWPDDKFGGTLPHGLRLESSEDGALDGFVFFQWSIDAIYCDAR